MEKKEFYTFDDLKKYLDFDDKFMKLSDYCKKEHLSMVIPLGTTIGQSVPPFFMETSQSTPGGIICSNTRIFDDIKEIVNYWVEERPKAKLLPKISVDKPQKTIEFLVKYMIAFSYLCKKRKSFPIDIANTYKIEELWMREGYISIIKIHHIKEGFDSNEKQSMKDINKSFFAYTKDKIDMM